MFFSKTSWWLKLSLWTYLFSYYKNTLDNILYFSWQRLQFLLVFRNIIYITLTNSSDTLLSSLLNGAYGKECLRALSLSTYKTTRCTHHLLHLQTGRRITDFFFFLAVGVWRRISMCTFELLQCFSSIGSWDHTWKQQFSFIHQILHCIQREMLCSSISSPISCKKIILLKTENYCRVQWRATKIVRGLSPFQVFTQLHFFPLNRDACKLPFL